MNKIPLKLKNKYVYLEIPNDYVISENCLSYVNCMFENGILKSKHHTNIETALKESNLYTKTFVCIEFSIMLDGILFKHCKEYRLIRNETISDCILQFAKGYGPSDTNKPLSIKIKAFEFGNREFISCHILHRDYNSKQNLPKDLFFDNITNTNKLWQSVQLPNATIVQQIAFLFHYFDISKFRHKLFINLSEFIPYFELKKHEITVEQDNKFEDESIQSLLHRFFDNSKEIKPQS